MSDDTAKPEQLTPKEYGRRGGKIGGKAKVPKGFAMLTPEQREEVQRRSAESRRRSGVMNKTSFAALPPERLRELQARAVETRRRNKLLRLVNTPETA